MRLRPGDRELFEAVDIWRNGRQDDRKRVMSQAEAVRRLLRLALKAEYGLAKR